MAWDVGRGTWNKTPIAVVARDVYLPTYEVGILSYQQVSNTKACPMLHDAQEQLVTWRSTRLTVTPKAEMQLLALFLTLGCEPSCFS
jgi:hypothetical protein